MKFYFTDVFPTQKELSFCSNRFALLLESASISQRLKQFDG